MIYRKATLADVPGVAVLYRDLAFHVKDSSQDAYWDFEEMPLDLTEVAVKEYVENEECCALVAEDNGELVGLMLLEVISCHLPISSHQRIGYIAGGYVKETYRRQGVMKKLEEMSNDFFKSISVKYVEVCYLPENAGAKEAWNSMGYQCFREQARKCLD